MEQVKDISKMDCGQKRVGLKVVAELLNEIGRRLSDEDKRVVARQRRVDKCAMRDVLNGLREDDYIMALLYAQATGYKSLRRYSYSLDGAGRLLKELRKTNQKLDEL